jgi:hypothetical protein
VSRQADSLADGHSVRELTVQLGSQLGQLLRDEIALARAEVFARARQATTGGVLISTAALLALTGWLALIAAAIAGIAVALPVWAAALIVGGFLMLIAGALVLGGRRRFRAVSPPTLTMQSLRRDVEEVKGRMGQH